MRLARHHELFSTARLAIFGALLVSALAAAAAADIIFLKNGGVLRGEIIKQDDKIITLRVPYGTINVEVEFVKSIEKEEPLRNASSDADELLKAGKVDAAIDKLEEALRRNPATSSVTDKLADAYRRRAEALEAKSQWIDADKAWRRSLELNPRDPKAAEKVREVDEVRNNASSAEQEADMLVTIGREREALDIFDRLSTYVPGSAEKDRSWIAQAHADYARRLLEFKRIDDACRHFDVALKLDPKLMAAVKHEVFIARLCRIITEMNEKGKTLSAARWNSMLAELQALKELEDNIHLHYAMAICYHELRQFTDAAREYAAVAGEKFNPDKAVDQLQALQQRARDKTHEAPLMLSFPQKRFSEVLPGNPRVLETPHFRIHHNNQELAELTAVAAEYYLERNYRLFMDKMPDNPWPMKCDIYIYRSQDEYLQHSHQAAWSPAMASTSAVAGVLESHHIMTSQVVEDFLASHLSHEITHIIHSAVCNYSGSIPMWLREGTAVGQEPWFKKMRMARVIREARQKNELMTLDQVLDQKGYPDADKVNLFYSQAYSLCEAIEQAGSKEQFRQFSFLTPNTSALKAISQVYGLSREELAASWQKHQEDLMSLVEKP